MFAEKLANKMGVEAPPSDAMVIEIAIKKEVAKGEKEMGEFGKEQAILDALKKLAISEYKEDILEGTYKECVRDNGLLMISPKAMLRSLLFMLSRRNQAEKVMNDKKEQDAPDAGFDEDGE